MILAAALLGSALALAPAQVAGSDIWAGIENDTRGAGRASVEFVVPSIDRHCGSGLTSNAAVWVGIGGVHGYGFAQLGVTLAPESRGAWYELFDHQDRGPVRDVELPINVGDRMRIRLAFSADHSKLLFVWRNLTTSEHRQRTINHARQYWNGSSVEWIVERSRDTLADFGSLRFESAHYSAGGTVHNLAPADREVAIFTGRNFDRRATRTTVDSTTSATVRWLRCGG